MSIAITEDHRSLAETVSSFAEKRNLRGAARDLLERPDDALPEFWGEFAELGWLGLHLPETVGGSGYGLGELVIVVEELARAVAPGPFVPTTSCARACSRGSPTVRPSAPSRSAVR